MSARPLPEPDVSVVEITRMRRRHVRGVERIEQQVYPRPWNSSLFLSELAMRSSRGYFVARVGRTVVGYAGMMLSGGDAHITTIAVDPGWQRYGIGTRLMLTLVHEAIDRRARNLMLEVRAANAGAQVMYRRFGLAPVGTKQNYYAETNEDALVMWVHDVDTSEYRDRLRRIEQELGL